MKIDKEILVLLETQKLYGNSYTYVRNKLSNLLGVKNKEIEKYLSNLAKEKEIKIIDDKVTKYTKDFANSKTVIDTTQKVIGTVLQNEDGSIFVKVRGFGERVCDVNQTELAKSSVGKTCLVKILQNTENVLFGNLEEVFGFSDDPISENVAIAAKYGFTNKFSDEVHNEAMQIPQEVTEKQREGRTNLEHIPFITIDPEGCKDKDDAIYDEPAKDGFKTYIAIADVSSGVLPNTELDKEAFKRGNSCYLGGGVYPMLPPELSNGTFSLDEGKPKLALVASARITYDGHINDAKVEYAIINVKKSYSYPEAEKTHDGVEGYDKTNIKTKKTLDYIYRNTKILENMFSKKLEFDSHEPAYKFADGGKTVDQIFLSNEEYSHTVIETRMILANEIVAQFFKDRGLVGLYRTHETIQPDKISALKNVLRSFGIEYDLQNTTQSIQNLLEVIKESPARDYLMAETIKSLPKAGYKATIDDVAHFGLGVTKNDAGYMHFTSPIRRYSDLITHRMLKDIINGKIPAYKQTTLAFVADHLNLQEKKADWAERESDSYLACMWAQNHLNEEMKGYISQIGKDFIKIMTANGTVPVSVPYSKLKNPSHERYKITQNGMALQGKDITYKLGNITKFRICDVDLETRMIFGDASEKELNNDNTKTEIKNFELQK